MQTIDTSVEVFEPIRYSAEDTCATQKRIAEHNSVYDTLRTGERVVYAAPCEIEAGSGDRAEKKVAGRRPEDLNRRTPAPDSDPGGVWRKTKEP